jgi:8-oxo-dGTP pyrophosphatase MutT (NUDIX family)
VTTSEEANPAIPAATVILLRDDPAGLSTLMLHRSSRGAFGGMWVFPGGRVEDEDRRDGESEEVTAQRAASREAVEECGLHLEPEELVPFSHWTPPPETARRFSTWFFVARAADGDVLVDGQEIHDHAWLSPAEVIARRDRGEVDLAPPTYVTLADLVAAGRVDDVIALARRRDPLPHYRTRFAPNDECPVCVWSEDAAYDTLDLTADGPRHRLWMRDGGWLYERDR